MMIPWYVKIPVKMALSRMPVSRSLLNRVGIFRHGSMVRPDYALEIVRRHLALGRIDVRDRVVLELGPGDSVGNGIIAYALGAERSILADAGDGVAKSPELYRGFVGWLEANLPDPTRLAEANRTWRTFPEMLEAFHITHLTGGVESLRGIPTASVDYSFSEAVLEHVRVDAFDETIREVRRALKPGTVSTHVVDYKDHLQAGLNNMRFSRSTWESPLFTRSGFYTNRLRHSDVRKSFEAAGFEILEDHPVRWPNLPTRESSIHPELRRYPVDMLLVKESSIVVRAAR